MVRLIKHSKITSFSDAFSKEQQLVFKRLDQLLDFLKKLKYEGKLYQRRNIKTAEKVLGTLKDTYAIHKEIDEGIIFPFLEQHIPKLDPFLRLLSTERAEFYSILGDCESLLNKFKKTKNKEEQVKTLEQICDKGIYAVALIKNHIQLEKESVYKAIDKELRPVEKDQLAASLKKHR